MGIGEMLLERCEQAAREKGFGKAEMGATFAGVGFYRGRVYEVLVGQEVDGVEERGLGNGEVLRLVRMGRSLV
jgi:GNAT superfamily N-acetyltransferase